MTGPMEPETAPIAGRLAVPAVTVMEAARMKLPEISSLSARTARQLATIDRLFAEAKLSPTVVKILIRCANEAVPGSHVAAPLRHALSPAFRRLNGILPFDANRSVAEQGICAALHDGAAHVSLLDAAAFRIVIDRIASATGGGIWRSNDIYSGTDARGYVFKYPPASNITRSLEDICIALRENTEIPSFLAMVTMCALFNIHPLQDGNGRVGRVMFNYIMQAYTGSSFYLPIYEIAVASSGGWLVALRQAQLYGDWERLADMLAYSLELFVSSR